MEKQNNDDGLGNNYEYEDEDCSIIKTTKETDEKKPTEYFITIQSPIKSQQIDGQNHSTRPLYMTDLFVTSREFIF